MRAAGTAVPRITLDTNRLIAGVGNAEGAAGEVLARLLTRRLQLVVSPDVVAEYVTRADRRSVMRLFQRRSVPPDEYRDVVETLVAGAVVVYPKGEAPPCRDESDRKFLHCAVAGTADYLVTGDHDLLVVESVGATAIVTPAELLRRLAAGGR